MSTEHESTNERIAELVLQQTFAERMALAKYMAAAISDWTGDGYDADAEYLAGLIEGWASGVREEIS